MIALKVTSSQSCAHTHECKQTHTHTETTLCTLEHNMLSERLTVCLMEYMNCILLKRVLIAKELD